jgi:hypothetical protein
MIDTTRSGRKGLRDAMRESDSPLVRREAAPRTDAADAHHRDCRAVTRC